MDIGCVTVQGRGATDRLLISVAKRLSHEGFCLAGALRVSNTETESGICNSTLRLLPDGAEVRISQDLGPGSSACRMDAGALEEAACLAEQRLEARGIDLVVLNKFGLSEAEGRGFRTLIAKALEREIPVLIGLSDTHREAFEFFAEGMATSLQPTEEEILDWYYTVSRKSPSSDQVPK